MRNLISFIGQYLLALALFASGAAMAGPTYRVSVDTGAYSGQGLMDFTFLANIGATPASALLANFGGAFGAEYERSAGVAGAMPGALVFDNQLGGSYLTQIVSLGGLFSFDVRFDGDFATVGNQDGSQFNVTLYTENFGGFVGAEGSFAAFALLPPSNGGAGGVQVSGAEGFATVAAVPEPSDFLLVLTGMGLMGLLRQRQKR